MCKINLGDVLELKVGQVGRLFSLLIKNKMKGTL